MISLELPHFLHRLGESRKKGRWDEAETEKLKKAVEEYQAAKAAAQSPGGGGGGEATTTISLAAIEGEPGGCCRCLEGRQRGL